MGNAPKVGDKITTWFSDESDRKSTVLAVRPYDGRYTEYFTYFVKVTAPRLRKGWLEICQ